MKKCALDTDVNSNSLKLTYIMGLYGLVDGMDRKELSLFTTIDPYISV